MLMRCESWTHNNFASRCFRSVWFGRHCGNWQDAAVVVVAFAANDYDKLKSRRKLNFVLKSASYQLRVSISRLLVSPTYCCVVAIKAAATVRSRRGPPHKPTTS